LRGSCTPTCRRRARALDRLDAGTSLFADLNQKWHQRAREHHPEWPSVPSEAYLALAGATIELVRSMVRAGWTDDLPKLEETLMALHLAVLAARPRPPGPDPERRPDASARGTARVVVYTNFAVI
jgi:hypothetical protein